MGLELQARLGQEPGDPARRRRIGSVYLFGHSDGGVFWYSWRAGVNAATKDCGAVEGNTGLRRWRHDGIRLTAAQGSEAEERDHQDMSSRKLRTIRDKSVKRKWMWCGV